MRVLIADDEPLALRRMGKLLREAGCEVVAECRDGVEVVEWLERTPGAVDALFLDIKMPGMDGIEVARAAQEVYPVVYVTGHLEFAVTAWEVNAAGYLQKPLSPQQVERVVARVDEVLWETRYQHGIPGVLVRQGRCREETILITEAVLFEVSDRLVQVLAGGTLREVVGMRSLEDVAKAYPRERWIHDGRNRLVRAS